MLSDLAFELACCGHDVHVVTSRLRYDDSRARLPPSETIDGVFVHRVATSRFGRSFLPGRLIDYLSFYWSATRCLFRYLCQGDVVVAKTDPPLISVPVGWVAGRKKAILVNWLQDLFPEVAAALGIKGMGGPIGGLLRRLRDGSLRRARVNIVLGQRMEALLCDRGIAPNRIRVIHNWADAGSVVPISRDDNGLRRQWRINGSFVVGYSGNLGRAHEFDTVVSAAEVLKGEPDILFLFIGGGALIAPLQQAVQQRGLENFRFEPYQPRESLHQSLSLPDVHLVSLLPQMEGLIVPSKLYGIAAAGRPVIFVGDPDGEIPRLLLPAEAGVTVEPGDGVGLARQILALRDNRADCERMGSNARGLLVDRFSTRVAFAAWEWVFNETSERVSESAG